ncbi:DegT/DnrJ/EryC1/StrS family aminotransferase [Mesoterricola silvestris]|uniref:Spore coat protein n=1 Tax=Mesoterricola silvestris TaxID=2927979 RepID=A0AA48GUR5_9BACT|nr:DegT/DnrJ/EryC1/StrS family aminotransferase [Mesoterricola silvestris]BDU74745.1 spore coat protein [Mesoterricola silvestris]
MSYVRREAFLPFTRPMVGQEEIAEIIDSIESGWITTGPKSGRFEEALQAYNGVPHCLVMNSATTAQEITLQCLGIRPGDEVITTALTWVSTLSTILLQGGVPVLVDIDPATLNLDAAKLEAAITPRTKGIIPVHLTGLPAPMDEVWRVAQAHGLWVVEDAAQAMGASYRGRKIGSDPRSVFSVYSFHPNKNMTTGEGGGIAFHDGAFEARIKRLRFHGIERDAWKRQSKEGSPHFDVTEPARKANFMDLQAAMGIHQIKKLDGFNTRRGLLFRRYLELLEDVEALVLPVPGDEVHQHCFHLFVARIRPEVAGMDRDAFVARLKEENIGTGIHYRPAHVHSFYRDFYREHPHALPGDGLPHTEWSGDRLMSLPLWPGLTEDDQDQVVAAIRHVLAN